jgi:hypothetical protein
MVTSATVSPSISTNEFHPALRVVAKIISYIFHPLFIPLYVLWFMVFDMGEFAGYSSWEKTKLMISFFVNYTFFPLVTILLMKALGFISSVFLKTQRDRILPYVVCEIFYFWAWYVARNNHYPKLMVLLALGIFLSTSLGLILNSYLKVSMHTISLGVVTVFALQSGLMTDMNFGPYISIVLLVTGLTATSRLISSDHTQAEIYTGFFAGAICQLIAYFFV